MAAPKLGSPDDLLPKQLLRNMQIVAGTLLGAVVVFAIVVVVIVQFHDQGQAAAAPIDSELLTWMACGAFVIWLPVASLITKRMTRHALSRIVAGVGEPDPRKVYATSLHGVILKLISRYIEHKLAARGIFRPQYESVAERILLARQSTIVFAFATLEGIGFFANLAYLIEGRILALAVTAAVVIEMIWRFPTAERTRAWVLQQAQEIERLQQAAPLGTT